MRDDVFKVKLGLGWIGWDAARLAACLHVSALELHGALAGNSRARDRALLRRAIVVIRDELERRCCEIERKYGVRRGEVLANLSI